MLQTLVLDGATNSTLRGLTLVNSRGFHVNLRRCSRVVAEGLGIHAPADSRNTDGIHVGMSSHVRILNSVIGTGDDCVSVGPGSVDVVVNGVTCGPGHGLRSVCHRESCIRIAKLATGDRMLEEAVKVEETGCTATAAWGAWGRRTARRTCGGW